MQTTKIMTFVAVAASLGVSLLFAQTDVAPRLDPAAAVTLDGPVVSFTSERGKPATLVVDDGDMGKTVVRLGPSWYLDDIGFTAATGEAVKVAAAHCTDCTAGHVAIRVENLANGAIAELRDDDGRPVWRGSGRANARASAEPGWHRGGRGCGQGWVGQGNGKGRGGGKGCGGQGCCGQGRGRCRSAQN